MVRFDKAITAGLPVISEDVIHEHIETVMIPAVLEEYEKQTKVRLEKIKETFI